VAWQNGIIVFFKLAPWRRARRRAPKKRRRSMGAASTSATISAALSISRHRRSVRPFALRRYRPLAGGQVGYNWQRGAGLLGFEADVSWADMDGTNTCFAYSGYYVSANCRVHIDALGTLAGRFGWILPSDGKTLLFGKAGLAWAHQDIAAKPSGGLGLAGTGDNGVDWGWTVGGCVERAVTYHWTVKAEYDFLSSDQSLTAPRSQRQTAPPGPASVTVGTSRL
jgi:opacity protein-like surface antigen